VGRHEVCVHLRIYTHNPLTQRHKGTKAQRHKGTKAQRHKGTITFIANPIRNGQGSPNTQGIKEGEEGNTQAITRSQEVE